MKTELLTLLPGILEESREEYENYKAAQLECTGICSAEGISAYSYRTDSMSPNILARCDNLDLLRHLSGSDDDMRGRIDLIYIDPPFFSNSRYAARKKMPDGTSKSVAAYSDLWRRSLDIYLRMLCMRLWGMKDLLAPDGAIWVHLDWHAAHYVKVLMDAIFGYDNFVNEIIWQYKSGGSTRRRFARKHDTLLFYSAGKDYHFVPQKEKSYNRKLKPYRFAGVEEYEDDIGWYTMVNMKDVWSIDMVGRTSGERTGYATQKPEALMERIITSCSEPGDICADFFGGSGSFVAAAGRMNRRWIYCDAVELAASICRDRMSMQNSRFAIYETE